MNTLLALWMLVAAAWAQDFAMIEEIRTPDLDGRWVAVETSAAAERVRDGAYEPLTVGAPLEVGDGIRTQLARVVIRLETGEQLTVREAAELTLQERSVLQAMGEVYYALRGAFSVDYRTVEATVEGTEFIMSGPDPVAVTVTNGAVRVTGADGTSALVQAGQTLAVPSGAPVPSPTKIPATQRADLVARSWARGRPRLVVAGLAEGGLTGNSASGGLRISARLSLGRVLALTWEPGFSAGSSTHLPAGLGLEAAIGGWSFGGQLVTDLEITERDCGGSSGTLHIGGAGSARLSIPLSRRFSVEGQIRVGAAPTIWADGAAGVGVAL